MSANIPRSGDVATDETGIFISACTARGFWDTGLKTMPPRQPIEAASDGTLLACHGGH